MKIFKKSTELHIALLAWKNGDITMIELKKYLQIIEIEARMSENNIAKDARAKQEWFTERGKFLQKSLNYVRKNV